MWHFLRSRRISCFSVSLEFSVQILTLTYLMLCFLKVAEELRSGVYEATGLTCSAGVGPNRLLAKVL